MRTRDWIIRLNTCAKVWPLLNCSESYYQIRASPWGTDQGYLHTRPTGAAGIARTEPSSWHQRIPCCLKETRTGNRASLIIIMLQDKIIAEEHQLSGWRTKIKHVVFKSYKYCLSHSFDLSLDTYLRLDIFTQMPLHDIVYQVYYHVLTKDFLN